MRAPVGAVHARALGEGDFAKAAAFGVVAVFTGGGEELLQERRRLGGDGRLDDHARFLERDVAATVLNCTRAAKTVAATKRRRDPFSLRMSHAFVKHRVADQTGTHVWLSQTAIDHEAHRRRGHGAR